MKQLSRRTILRGLGTTLALPFLDAMVPAFASAAAQKSLAINRMAFLYVPNGIVMPSWVISAVVCVPGGAQPSYVDGYYGRDNAFYREWDVIARDRNRFNQGMDEKVLDCVVA